MTAKVMKIDDYRDTETKRRGWSQVELQALHAAHATLGLRQFHTDLELLEADNGEVGCAFLNVDGDAFLTIWMYDCCYVILDRKGRSIYSGEDLGELLYHTIHGGYDTRSTGVMK